MRTIENKVNSVGGIIEGVPGLFKVTTPDNVELSFLPWAASTAVIEAITGMKAGDIVTIEYDESKLTNDSVFYDGILSVTRKKQG